MRCCLRLFCWLALIGFLAVLPGSAQAQTFTGEQIPFSSLALHKRLTNWEVYSLDADLLHEAAKNAMTAPAPITLELGTYLETLPVAQPGHLGQLQITGAHPRWVAGHYADRAKSLSRL